MFFTSSSSRACLPFIPPATPPPRHLMHFPLHRSTKNDVPPSPLGKGSPGAAKEPRPCPPPPIVAGIWGERPCPCTRPPPLHGSSGAWGGGDVRTFLLSCVSSLAFCGSLIDLCIRSSFASRICLNLFFCSKHLAFHWASCKIRPPPIFLPQDILKMFNTKSGPAQRPMGTPRLLLRQGVFTHWLPASKMLTLTAKF